MGTDKSVSKEFPATMSSATSLRPSGHNTATMMANEKGLFDNGDVFSAKKDFSDGFGGTELLPEDIPGLPRHRPTGAFSPR